MQYGLTHYKKYEVRMTNDEQKFSALRAILMIAKPVNGLFRIQRGEYTSAFACHSQTTASCHGAGNHGAGVGDMETLPGASLRNPEMSPPSAKMVYTPAIHH